jgi:epoxyqueuosine reductase
MTLLTFSHIQQACLGFDQVAALPLAQAQQVSQQAASYLTQWLEQGQYADMTWLPRSLPLRQNPALLMENTQTVVIVTLNYYQPMPNPPPVYKVARYAWGQDYHKVMKQKLKAALKQLQAQHPDLNGRPLVDSAPVMEKALAVAAGLGWQGKHSNLIAPQLGSWVFIGVLLLDKPLEQPPALTPLPDYCGRCTRCVDACPTQAINPDTRSVNSNQCIAYWTIESDVDSLPPAISQNQQGWLFGCDICQEVCPWNHKWETPTKEVSFTDRNVSFLDNTKPFLLNSDNTEFNTVMKVSSAKRTGQKNLVRNLSHIDKTLNSSR